MLPLPIASTVRPTMDPLRYAIGQSIHSHFDYTFPENSIALIADFVGDYSTQSSKTSAQLYAAFAAMSNKRIPTELVNIVAEYCKSDYADALLDFETDESGRLAKSPVNNAIWAARTEALISYDCNPIIKRMIVHKGMHGIERDLLQSIIDGIRAKGYRLNLDCTDLSGFNLRNFNLSGMSAVCATLRGTVAYNSNFDRADLTNAYIDDVWFDRSTMAKATLSGAKLVGGYFYEMELSGTNAKDVVCCGTTFNKVNVSGLLTNNAYLTQFIDQTKKNHRIDALFGRCKLTAVFSTASGCDVNATLELLSKARPRAEERENVCQIS